MRVRLASSTCRVRLMSARSYFAYLIGKGQRRTDPTAGIKVNLKKQLPGPPYSTDELRRLLAACRSTRDRALLLLFIGSGARRAELFSLQARQIDWGRGTIRVLGKGAKERTLAPGLVPMAALRTYLGQRIGPVWLSRYGRPVSRSGAWKVIQSIAGRAGVGHAYFHRFRHTYATAFLKESQDLLALKMTLGHATWDMVERYVEYGAHERALDQQRNLSLADRL